jgi:bifunctional UDP-N-acetylglucosamine pyrophosphorylase / glucosamine-1-phosphate N-acetyltransferase
LNVATLILAAGYGTRMKSKLAKVLHPVGGRAMIARSVATARKLEHEPVLVVVGHDADAIKQHLDQIGTRAETVLQPERKGTGHAVAQAADALRGKSDLVVVYYADMPLLTAATLQKLITEQRQHAGPFTLLTVNNPNPRGFGRIVKQGGHVVKIVEEVDATLDERAITELNVGVYCFNAAWLWAHIGEIQPNTKNGEYFLTDLVQIAVDRGEHVYALATDDLDEVIGVNTRGDLADAEAALRRRLCRQWQLAGVTITDPATTYISEDALIGQDTVIAPNTHLIGRTSIGADCIIGPNSVIRDSKIGDACVVNASVVEEATLENHVDVGPFAHLRPRAYLCEGVHMGNFGEVKASRLGPGTRMGHFSYIGDAEIGADVNIGAGVITANFDGVHKHRTRIDDHAFIGSDTILRAPVSIGERSRTGAGSVVTKNVPPDTLAVGIPARLRALSDPNRADRNTETEKEQ